MKEVLGAWDDVEKNWCMEISKEGLRKVKVVQYIPEQNGGK